jgi:hypothetical protein
MSLRYEPVSGKTYTLFGGDSSTDQYFSVIRAIADSLSAACPDQGVLLHHVQMAGGLRLGKRPSSGRDDTLITLIRETLERTLHPYTRAVKEHLRSMPLSQRFDKIIRTREEKYHLYMIEIELVNRLYGMTFEKAVISLLSCPTA